MAWRSGSGQQQPHHNQQQGFGKNKSSGGPFASKNRRSSVSGPKAVVLPSLKTSTGISSSGESAYGSPELTNNTNPSSNLASMGDDSSKEKQPIAMDYSILADHAWVDDEGEMDYDFVPFSDDSSLLLLPPPLPNSSSVNSAPLADEAAEEDPVIKALRQRQEADEMERLELERLEQAKLQKELEETKKRLELQEKQEREKRDKSHQVQLQPKKSWRDTARPIVAQPATAAVPGAKQAPIKIATRPKPEIQLCTDDEPQTTIAIPKSPSLLDQLISSIKNAAISHSSSPVSDRSLLFGPSDEHQEPELPVTNVTTVSTRATDQAKPPSRTIIVKLQPSDPPIITKFAVSTDSYKVSVHRPALSLQGRHFKTTALTVQHDHHRR